MKIYTKSGDDMTTSIVRQRVKKDHAVVEANGTIDELMSSLMIAYHHVQDEEIKNIIITVVKDLSNLMADILIDEKQFISQDNINYLEQTIDHYEKELPPLIEFIVPGKDLASSHLHFSRTICRRAERRVVTANNEKEIKSEVVLYLNRLSDLLFVLARFIDL